jgi:hypothetical protein
VNDDVTSGRKLSRSPTLRTTHSTLPSAASYSNSASNSYSYSASPAQHMARRVHPRARGVVLGRILLQAAAVVARGVHLQH